MVEVLAAGLPGSTWSHDALSLGDDVGGPPRLGSTIIAIRADRAGFAGRVESLLMAMAEQPGVRIPGDRRHANRRRIEVEGVSVDEDLIGRLRILGARLQRAPLWLRPFRCNNALNCACLRCALDLAALRFARVRTGG